MSGCRLAAQCVFFSSRESGEELREYFTGRYCAGNFHDCARYRAALEMGFTTVPDDILPNEDAFVSIFAWSMGGPDHAQAASAPPRAGTDPAGPPKKLRPPSPAPPTHKN